MNKLRIKPLPHWGLFIERFQTLVAIRAHELIQAFHLRIKCRTIILTEIRTQSWWVNQPSIDVELQQYQIDYYFNGISAVLL